MMSEDQCSVNSREKDLRRNQVQCTWFYLSPPRSSVFTVVNCGERLIQQAIDRKMNTYKEQEEHKGDAGSDYDQEGAPEDNQRLQSISFTLV